MRILIVDDDQMLCESLKIILSSYGLAVVGTANNGDIAVDFCHRHPVDVILMDIRMPICDGVMGTRKIKALFPDIKIIILTTFDDDEYITQALKNGASAYLLKTINPQKMVETIKLIYEGNIVLHSDIANKLAALISDDKKLDFTKYNLNNTHQAIIKLIAEGLNNREIAQKLHMSEGTIRNKISDILLELNLRDRTQIAIFWHTAGGKAFPIDR